MDVQEIVKDYLEENEFDGLFNQDGDCACLTSDLAPCEEINGDCEPGHLMPCDCGEHDWHIGIKPAKAKSKFRRFMEGFWAVLQACMKNGRSEILRRKESRRGTQL